MQRKNPCVVKSVKLTKCLFYDETLVGGGLFSKIEKHFIVLVLPVQ